MALAFAAKGLRVFAIARLSGRNRDGAMDIAYLGATTICQDEQITSLRGTVREVDHDFLIVMLIAYEIVLN